MSAQGSTESFQSWCFTAGLCYVLAPSVITVGNEGVTVIASWAPTWAGLVVTLHQDMQNPSNTSGFIIVCGDFCVCLVKPLHLILEKEEKLENLNI